MKRDLKPAKFTCDVGPDGIIATPGVYAMMRTVFVRFAGERIKITIERYRELRSLKQNAYHWAVVIPCIRKIMIRAGNDWTDLQIHEWLKQHVGGLVKVIHNLDGSESEIVLPSKELTTVQWERFMERIRQWADELGYHIPLPGENIPEGTPTDDDDVW